MKQTDIMNVIQKPVSEVIPYENNPRRNAQAVHDVAESIRRYGFQQPLVIDREGVIVVGHTRFLAAKELELDTVPCVVSRLTDEQNRAYRLVDNKTAEGAEWDFAKLEAELDSLDFGGFDFGFKTADQYFDHILNDEFATRDAQSDRFAVTFHFPSDSKATVDDYLKAHGKESLEKMMLEAMKDA